ncbi:MAG: hypothetical protein AUK21_02390 [Parcubacteria group bacterium CG2_30_48_51]|nr:MAG: hypothetical protein AUK21_02390 [Parcubacteria group bacterium CG2_30_48_51]
MLQFATAHAVLFSFIIATAATLGSLFYSEIAGYEPCKLCWFERIFMYPQSLVFLVALWKRERVILRYALLLSLIGCGISLYHYLMQIGFAPSLSCEVVGYSASCAQRFVLQFGYVTIPFMAFSAFLLLALLQIFGVRYIRHSPSAHT